MYDDIKGKSENKTDKLSHYEQSLLKDLAMKVADLSSQPIEKVKADLWTASNDLKPIRPLVFIDPENGWNELISQESLKCSNPLARSWEMYLLKQIYWVKELCDDKVIEPYIDIPVSYTTTGWGLPLNKRYSSINGSYKVIASLTDYDCDFSKLHFPEIIIDEDKSNKELALAHELFDGILKVRQKTQWWWSLGMTSDYINLRGLEDFMTDMLLYPAWVHKMMKFLSDGYLKRLDFLEKKGLLCSNNGGTYVGSGGFGWTEQLPNEYELKHTVTTHEMWGFCESQESVAISPEMYNEFILPYQMPIMQRFGLNCYGCCEPVNSRWKYIKNIPNLRRVSISPWANKAECAGYLQDKYILSFKLSPSPLALYKLNEEIVRNEIKEALFVSKNLSVELIMKDNHTLGNNPNNAKRWVQIAREEIERSI